MSGKTTFPQYFAGQLLSQLAYNMLVVAVGWQIYDLTNSALALGLIGLVQFLPQFLLILIAGHFADHDDPRPSTAFAKHRLSRSPIELATPTFRCRLAQSFQIPTGGEVVSGGSLQAHSRHALQERCRAPFAACGVLALDEIEI